MARIVRKYGGSSLREPEQLRNVAKTLADMKWNGDELVIVVSAMAATTDDLIELARELNPNPPHREMDMLLSVGERISCALLAMALEAEGVGAISYTGSQVGIITDTHHGEARIVDVRPTRLLKALEEGFIVVVAGFQGVSIDKEITTLGRGGSDLTAVALAAAINADRCELMKDVNGIYTAHPGIVPSAELIERLDYGSALRMARGGTKALQSEAARLAQDHHVTLALGNSSTDKIGTIITERPFDCGEVVGIARRDGLTRIQGTGPLPPSDGLRRVVEQRGRWILWQEGNSGDAAPLSGITVVTSGRRIDEMQTVITSSLEDKGIESYGLISTDSEIWICVETAQADDAVRRLHNEMIQHGWLQVRKDPA
jgi:aspartate kinase